jgi:hypothetical protein
MVRREGGAALTVALLSATGEPIVRLRIDSVEFWTLERIQVLSTPDNVLVGARFPHINLAMGQLKKFFPRPAGPHEYLELLHAYVVGPLDETLLGASEIPFKLYGQTVSTRHSPGLATAPVRILAGEPHDKGGRWLPVSVLRPFVPPSTRDDEAETMVKERMRAGKHVPFVREAFRRAPPPTGDGGGQLAAGAKRKLPSRFETAAELLERRHRSDGGDACTADPGAASTSAVEHAVGPAPAVLSKPGASCGSTAAGGKRREKWFDKKGNVVVARLQGDMELALWPVCLVVIDKQHGPPKGSSNSPRYVVTSALPPAQSAPTDTWHISEVEPLREALPRAWRWLCDPHREVPGGRVRLREAMVHAVIAQSKAPAFSNRDCFDAADTWDWLVPEARGRWSELTQRPAVEGGGKNRFGARYEVVGL